MRNGLAYAAVRYVRTHRGIMHPDVDVHPVRTDAVQENQKGKGFGDQSLIGPLDVPDAEGRLVLLLPVECHTFAALAVPGAFLVGTTAILRDKTVLAHR